MWLPADLSAADAATCGCLPQAVAPFSLLLQTALYLRSAGGLTLQQHLHQAVLLLLRGGALVAFTLVRHDTWLRRR